MCLNWFGSVQHNEATAEVPSSHVRFRKLNSILSDTSAQNQLRRDIDHCLTSLARNSKKGVQSIIAKWI